MHTKYYVALRPQINENHAVHKEGCPFLPDDEKRIYLGEFSSGQDAVKESHQYFNKTKGCIFCAKEQKAGEKKPLLSDWVKKEIIPAKLEIRESIQLSLFCCIN
jgi:hypothetical protein